MDLSNIVFGQTIEFWRSRYLPRHLSAESQGQKTWATQQSATCANAEMCAEAKSGTDVPIWASCFLGDLEGVRSGLASGHYVNDRSPGGVSGLMYVCSWGRKGILDLLLVDFKC